MISFQNEITIDRRPGEVFDYLADFTHIPQWNYWVRSVRQTTPDPIGIGTTYHQIRRDDQQRYNITEHTPPNRLTVQTLHGDHPAFRRTMSLEADGNATLLVDDWELDSGHPAVLQRLLAGKAREGVADNLARLRELLERGHTQLQDGRSVQLTL